MIGNLAQFWRLTRELDLSSIRQDFERSINVLVLGTERQAAVRLVALLTGRDETEDVRVGVLGDRLIDRAADVDPDLYVAILTSSLDSAARRALADLSIGDAPLLVVQQEGAGDVVVLGVPDDRMLRLEDSPDDAATRDQLVNALVRVAPEVMLPLGRRYPVAREAVARHLIRDSARVNAQFAAISSLPANIPLLGGLVGDMADMLVLTKNQVVLLFKLAGLYGRNLELGQQLLVEVVPVVGSAFVWRSGARALVGLLPGLFAALPKMMVAYVGTYVVGEMARYYYATGRPPSRELVASLQREGMELARGAVKRVRSLQSPRDPSDPSRRRE